MDILTLNKVLKSFGEKKILKEISFSVPEGSIFGFIGQNGAGKTTTMKMILGLLKIDQGEISVCGEKVSFGQNATNQYIGYLPDVPEFYDFMTPREYLMLCGKITGMSKSMAAERAEELLERVGLAGEKKRIRGFSRGMKQRLGVAQALLNQPKLLICDEPTSALDPLGRKELLDILVQAKKDTTILFSTHILSDVERICDEIAFLHGGELVMQGNLDEIVSSMPQKVWACQTSHEKAAKLMKQYKVSNMKSENGTVELRIISARQPLEHARLVRPNLEDVFLYYFGGKGGDME